MEGKMADNDKVELPPGHTWIYVFQQGREPMCKIGRSKHLVRRANAIRTGSGRGLAIAFAVPIADYMAGAVEEAAHTILKLNRLQGEWFAVTGAVAEEAVVTAVGQVVQRSAVRNRPSGGALDASSGIVE